MGDPMVDAIRWARESAAHHESEARLYESGREYSEAEASMAYAHREDAARFATLADAAEGALSEREERDKLSRALAAKDEAMGELFRRLDAAGVDYSDLVS